MPQLDPIQQKIAAGMSPLVAFFSEKTCGEACWQAREDICRCSCGGKNHGCMRSADGTRPERTAKIDERRYVLKATCVQDTRPKDKTEAAARHDVYEQCMRLNTTHGPRERYRSWDTNIKDAPARIRNATKSQMNWPELTSYRERIDAIKAAGGWCWNDIMNASPQLLWVREDVAEKEATAI